MASRTKASRTSKSKAKRQTNDSDLKLSSVTCPVCLSILIEPVTMPCSHELCMPCFKKYVEETSLLCPVCRKRISTWARQASREGTLINVRRWRMIQKCFPDNVKRRLNGDESDDDNPNSVSLAQIRLSRPGEIRKEYEDQLKKLNEEIAKQRELETERSEKFIQELQAKEQEDEAKRKQEIERLLEDDHKLALLISQQLNNTMNETIISGQTQEVELGPIPSTSFEGYKQDEETCVSCKKCDSDSNLVHSKHRSQLFSAGCPVEGKRKRKRSRTSSLASDDSITPELCHFRPIKVAPKTPPRRMRNGKEIYSSTSKHSKVAVRLCLTKGVESVVKTSALKKRLLNIENDRKKKKRNALKQCRENISDPTVENESFHYNGSKIPCKRWAKLHKRKPLSSTNCAESQTQTRRNKSSSLWPPNIRQPSPDSTENVLTTPMASRGAKLTGKKRTCKRTDKLSKRHKVDTDSQQQHDGQDQQTVNLKDKGKLDTELDINCNECPLASCSSTSLVMCTNDNSCLSDSRVLKAQQEQTDRLFAIRLMEEEQREYSNFITCGRTKYNLRKRSTSASKSA